MDQLDAVGTDLAATRRVREALCDCIGEPEQANVYAQVIEARLADTATSHLDAGGEMRYELLWILVNIGFVDGAQLKESIRPLVGCLNSDDDPYMAIWALMNVVGLYDKEIVEAGAFQSLSIIAALSDNLDARASATTLLSRLFTAAPAPVFAALHYMLLTYIDANVCAAFCYVASVTEPYGNYHDAMTQPVTLERLAVLLLEDDCAMHVCQTLHILSAISDSACAERMVAAHIPEAICSVNNSQETLRSRCAIVGNLCSEGVAPAVIDKGGLDLLLAGLRDPSEPVRHEAAYAASTMASCEPAALVSHVRQLVALLDDPSERVVHQVLGAITNVVKAMTDAQREELISLPVRRRVCFDHIKKSGL